MDILLPILIFMGWFVLCGAVGKYAENKGRNGIGIFFLSFFLSPLVGFVVALAMSPNEKKVAAAQGKKRCPECAEFVQPDAKTCRFCQHKFTEAEQLAAAGMSAGPPCPKCASISTLLIYGESKGKPLVETGPSPLPSLPQMSRKMAAGKFRPLREHRVRCPACSSASPNSPWAGGGGRTHSEAPPWKHGLHKCLYCSCTVCKTI